MKTSIFSSAIRTALLICILFATCTMWSQKGQTAVSQNAVVITLRIKANELFNQNGKVIPENYSELTHTPNNDSTTIGNKTSFENFVTEVNVGDLVIWQARRWEFPNDALYDVKIIQVTWKEGENIFGDPVIANSGGVAVGTVIYPNSENGIYTYHILFSIEYNGEIKYYTIDPDLKSNT